MEAVRRPGQRTGLKWGGWQSPGIAGEAQVLNVHASRLRYPQPVEGEQGNQGVLGGRAEPGGDEDGAELVAVQGGDV